MNKLQRAQNRTRPFHRIPVSTKPTSVIRPKKGKGSYDRRKWKNDTQEKGYK